MGAKGQEMNGVLWRVGVKNKLKDDAIVVIHRACLCAGQIPFEFVLCKEG